MNDPQAAAKPAAHSIPLISPVLHFVSMPVVVFWRHRFGFAYLGPKSIFFATIWATLLMSYIVWHEPRMKEHFGSLSIFAIVAACLYLAHLAQTFFSETRSRAEHDKYSGKSWLLSLRPDSNERTIHTLVEPGLTILIGAIAIILTNAAPFGRVLVIAGFSLCAKEMINIWLTLRSKKKVGDTLSEAAASIPVTENPVPPINATQREPFRKFQRNAGPPPSDQEVEHATVLGLTMPVTLASVNAAYRDLVGKAHPDLNPDDAQAGEKTRKLNEAVEYFRRSHGC